MSKTIAAKHDTIVTNASPRVGELMTIGDAARALGWSWWQTRRAMDRGELEGVLLPGNRRAVVRASVERRLAATEPGDGAG